MSHGDPQPTGVQLLGLICLVGLVMATMTWLLLPEMILDRDGIEDDDATELETDVDDALAVGLSGDGEGLLSDEGSPTGDGTTAEPDGGEDRTATIDATDDVLMDVNEDAVDRSDSLGPDTDTEDPGAGDEDPDPDADDTGGEGDTTDDGDADQGAQESSDGDDDDTSGPPWGDGPDGTGPPGQDDSGPPGQDDSGPPGQDDSGPPGQDDSGPPGQDDSDQPGPDDTGPAGQEDD